MSIVVFGHCVPCRRVVAANAMSRFFGYGIAAFGVSGRGQQDSGQ